MDNLLREAGENLRRLSENTYPGRGIVLGQSPGGKLLQFYWIMGRSENSRNRLLVQKGCTVRTEPFEGSTLENPGLVIYTAMNEVAGQFIVSNGDHTDTICEVLKTGGSYHEALHKRNHEPDEPHFTPRIAGGINLNGGGVPAWLAMVKADPFDSQLSNRFFYEFSQFNPGFGWCITTYRGDGTPLPAYSGEPFVLPLQGEEDELMGWLWYRLNEGNRVSLALKIIDPNSHQSETKIVNKYE